MVHLHVVGVLLDVGDDAVFVRDRCVEEVADLTAAAADVEVEVLVDREILEHQVVPVVVRIEVLVEPRLRAVDLVGRVERLVGVERSGLLGGVEDGLVVELHVGHAVGHLLCAGSQGGVVGRQGVQPFRQLAETAVQLVGPVQQSQ